VNSQDLIYQAYEALIDSHLLTATQWESGQRLELDLLTCIHYEYEWDGGSHSADNFFVWGPPAEEVLGCIRRYGPAEKHLIYVLVDRPRLVNEYMVAGCNVMTPGNFLMGHTLEHIAGQLSTPEYRIHKASSAGETVLLNSIDGADLVRLEDVLSQDLQYYYATDAGQPVATARYGWIESYLSWVSHVYTDPAHRGRGLAALMMNRIMIDSKAEDSNLSFLLATEPAHGLYLRLGYSDLASILTFQLATPPTNPSTD
jgi:GNAT superfamily N-acetyltransferase